MMKRETKIKIAVVLQSLCQGLQYTVSPVLNQVGQAYPTVPTSLVQMLVTAPALTSMAVALAAGWLVTKIPKKRLVLLGCLVMGTGDRPDGRGRLRDAAAVPPADGRRYGAFDEP